MTFLHTFLEDSNSCSAPAGHRKHTGTHLTNCGGWCLVRSLKLLRLRSIYPAIHYVEAKYEGKVTLFSVWNEQVNDRFAPEVEDVCEPIYRRSRRITSDACAYLTTCNSAVTILGLIAFSYAICGCHLQSPSDIFIDHVGSSKRTRPRVGAIHPPCGDRGRH
jgi:hypothetical protein